MHCTSYGACEHETLSDLNFEVKQIQFAPEFINRFEVKKFSYQDKIWLINIHEKIGLEKEVWIIKNPTQLRPQ